MIYKGGKKNEKKKTGDGDFRDKDFPRRSPCVAHERLLRDEKSNEELSVFNGCKRTRYVRAGSIRFPLSVSRVTDFCEIAEK